MYPCSACCFRNIVHFSSIVFVPREGNYRGLHYLFAHFCFILRNYLGKHCQLYPSSLLPPVNNNIYSFVMYDIPLLAFIFLSRASSRIILDGKHIIRSNNTSKASNHQHKTVLEIRRKIADGNDDYLPHNRVYGIVKAKEIGETSCHSYSCKWGQVERDLQVNLK